MSYPSGPPGNSGYPSGPSASQYSAPTQQFGHTQDFGHAQEAAPTGPSKLPQYLDIAVAALGVLVYLTTFALDNGPTLGPVAAILAGLLAGVGLVPKQKTHVGVVAVLAVLGFLLVLSDVITVGAGDADWPWYVLIALTLLQAIAAVAALLLDAGVITAPVPKPKYEQNPYGQYGAPGQYYGQLPGQLPGQPQYGGPPHQPGPQQRGGYPQQQYGGYPSSPSTGGFNAQAPQQSAAPQSGPPTPPTGFPAFGSPQGSTGSQPTQTFETQQPQQQAAPQSAPPPS